MGGVGLGAGRGDRRPSHVGAAHGAHRSTQEKLAGTRHPHPHVPPGLGRRVRRRGAPHCQWCSGTAGPAGRLCGAAGGKGAAAAPWSGRGRRAPAVFAPAAWRARHRRPCSPLRWQTRSHLPAGAGLLPVQRTPHPAPSCPQSFACRSARSSCGRPPRERCPRRRCWPGRPAGRARARAPCCRCAGRRELLRENCARAARSAQPFPPDGGLLATRQAHPESPPGSFASGTHDAAGCAWRAAARLPRRARTPGPRQSLRFFAEAPCFARCSCLRTSSAAQSARGRLCCAAGAVYPRRLLCPQHPRRRDPAATCQT